MDALSLAPATSVSCNLRLKTCQRRVQNTALVALHVSCTQWINYFTALICRVPPTPLNRFACFHPWLVVLPASMSTAPFRLLLSQNENIISDNKQHSVTCRSNRNYPSDSKAHHLPELSRMMDLRHTNSSPWRFIMRNRAAVASSMSKISTMPSTHFPWFLCEYRQGGDIHSFNLMAAWAFHPPASLPSSLISSVH